MMTLIDAMKFYSLAFPIIVVMSACTDREPVSKVHLDQDVLRIMRELERCPAWTTLPTDHGIDEMKQKEMLTCFNLLARERTPTLRTAVSHLIAKWKAHNNYTVDNASKIFVMNRYIFNIPPSEVTFSDATHLVPWSGVPGDDKNFDMLWPFGRVEGELVLVGHFRGYYGDEYDVVREFDYFNQKFGRRTAK